MPGKFETIVAGMLFGLSALVGAQAQNQVSDLPEGPGKVLVEGICTACHQTNQITRSSGYSSAGWQALFSTMVDLSASPREQQEIAHYLATHFPPNTRRAPQEVAGDVQITFHEWQVPTLGQRARDPIQAQDGTIWWAGQWGNLIGRIDPVSGQMQEYPLPQQSMPHSVTLDQAGNVWYTGNKNATIGKFDPKTETIQVYTMPDPDARDPHTAIFDPQGILWFTLQHSNKIGRLDPESGEIRLLEMKTPRSRPYGIKIDAQGMPWVACNGSNCLVKVDPQTLELTEIKLPDAATTVRRLDIASDGMIWYVNSSQGRLGRYNPHNGEIKEWPSPSGPKSHPYAIAIVDDIVWYNESGKRPDMLVRFDPKTEQFQSWPIPSGEVYAGIIRHMRPTAEGNLLIHQSSTNRIIEVRLAPTPEASMKRSQLDL